MQEIFKAMARMVSNDLTVLISGESGTGKELVTRALHDLGHRKAGQFLAVNLAAVPRDMVEIELFGQVGPRDEIVHQGCFAKADGGTLFLDEVGDMPAAVQTRLLRVLQDNRYLPVGANRPVGVDLRIMASTNQNLHHLMHQGLFQEDLFYRLNVVPLKLPPLRERAEDIGPLISHFIARAEADGMPAKRFTPDALQRLKVWHWPGNVRELENLLRRLLVLHVDDFIDASVIDRELFDQTPIEPVESESLSGSVDMHIRRYFQALKGGMPAPGLYGRILREVEHPLIVATLEMTRGNQVRAADILGLNRNTLRKKITELNIRAGR